MAGAQLENGYTRIANELMEAALVAGFSKRQLLVFFWICRKTYGFNKKTDDMTVQQIANGTALQRQHASAALSELVEKRAVLKRDGVHGYVLGINKNFSEWRPSQNSSPPPVPKRDASRNSAPPVPKQDGDRPKTVQNTVPKQCAQKTGTKDNSKRQLQKTVAQGPNGTAPEAKTAATWKAYAEAYEARYGVAPLRNAKVNGQLVQFVNRVGADVAPLVAAYYVGHNGQFYVQRGHQVGMLLNDAEKLHTECMTGRQVTSRAARQTDERQDQSDMYQRLIEKARAQR